MARPLSLLLLLAFTPLVPANAQASSSVPTNPSSCPAPPTILTSSQPNIFSDQQEQWLGDAMADQIERFTKPVQDPAENEYLTYIAKRLLAALPPTTIQFRVILVESPEVNGFSLAGGRVYLTRKLVANARNEDEVASVIGHEMGHILTHQFALETTADFRRLLGVTSVTDKADIYSKYQRLTDARTKDQHPSPGGNSDDKQDQADTIAVYAVAAAGYRPQAFAEFWDRIFKVEGKTGNRLSDFFDYTTPMQKRLRGMLKLVGTLPPGCGAAATAASPAFLQWQTLVIANQAGATAASDASSQIAKPISQIALTPPLRMDLDRLRFSRDGKYILAQDESSVSVLSREPYAQIFRFDADMARAAEFSPDSLTINFHTSALHTEQWDIATRKLLAAHEPFAHKQCVQTRLSPDGRTLFCISAGEPANYGTMLLNLTMIDAASGDTLFEAKAFGFTSVSTIYQIALSQLSPSPIDLVSASVSADGNVLLIGYGSHKLAFDLRTRTQIPIAGALKGQVDGDYAFLGSDRIIGVNRYANNLSGVFSFPEGKRIQVLPIGLADLESVTAGDFVLSHSITQYAVGLADVATAKFIVASRTLAMDVWNGLLLHEDTDGSVVLNKLNDKTVADQSITLPLSPLAASLNAVISDDHHLLALSTRTRTAVWDLRTGHTLLTSRRFNSASFAPDNTLYAEFPEVDKQVRAIRHFSFAPLTATAVAYSEDDNTHLLDQMLQEWKPLPRNAFELIVHNVADNAVLWRRTFDDGRPGHTANLIPGKMILAFFLNSDYARVRLKAAPILAAQASAIRNRDTGRLLQIIDDRTGTILHELVLDAPAYYEGVAGINVVGNSLYLSSADNRTMVYNLTTATQLRQLFGSVIAADAASSRICSVNRQDEAHVYDPDGRELANFRTASPIRFAAFQLDGTQILLVTADQQVRTWQLPDNPPPGKR